MVSLPLTSKQTMSSTKTKECGACSKTFTSNKKLLEHVEKEEACNQVYKDQDLELPVVKVGKPRKKSMPQSSSEQSSTQEANSRLYVCSHCNADLLRPGVDTRLHVQGKCKVGPSSVPSDDKASKAKKYPIDFQILVIEKLQEEEANGNIDFAKVAKDMRVSVALVEKWWRSRDKLFKLRDLR